MNFRSPQFSTLLLAASLLSQAVMVCDAQQLDTDTLSGIHSKHSATIQNRPLERYIPPGFNAPSPSTGMSPAIPSAKPATSGDSTVTSPSATGFTETQPLTASVTHTLYLPPAMYGQWNVTGTLMQTNAPDQFSPQVNDIWLLEREGNQVTVTNPVNGAYATVSIDKTEGDQATFHRSGTAGDHAVFQEIPTITVHGDSFSGQSLNKIQKLRNGQVTAEIYGLYHLEATRISAGRTRFHPDTEQQSPDLQIEEIQH